MSPEDPYEYIAFVLKRDWTPPNSDVQIFEDYVEGMHLPENTKALFLNTGIFPGSLVSTARDLHITLEEPGEEETAEAIEKNLKRQVELAAEALQELRGIDGITKLVKQTGEIKLEDNLGEGLGILLRDRSIYFDNLPERDMTGKKERTAITQIDRDTQHNIFLVSQEGTNLYILERNALVVRRVRGNLPGYYADHETFEEFKLRTITVDELRQMRDAKMKKYVRIHQFQKMNRLSDQKLKK